jgi:hypothetical protein
MKATRKSSGSLTRGEAGRILRALVRKESRVLVRFCTRQGPPLLVLIAGIWGCGGGSGAAGVDGVPPPESRQVLLEGVVDLEPEPRCCVATARAYLVFDVPAAGVLDMFVDWGSASNQVIAHMCQGETGFPLGCVPIIDGTRHMGMKPVSASTHTTAGPHTLWITNGGQGVETVRYEVGFIRDGA